MKLDYRQLDEARKRRKETVESACLTIGVSAASWRKWRSRHNHGVDIFIHPATATVVRMYIQESPDA